MKYEITNEVKVIFGRTLYRIKAIKSFANVVKGELGGWIENTDNLSQEGNSWISENGMVFGNARVFDNARIYGSAKVYDNACVTDNARISGNATVADNGYLRRPNDIVVIGPIGSRCDFTTFYKKSSVEILVKCGCFKGTIDEFENQVEKTHGDNKYAKVYKKAIEVAKSMLIE